MGLNSVSCSTATFGERVTHSSDALRRQKLRGGFDGGAAGRQGPLAVSSLSGCRTCQRRTRTHEQPVDCFDEFGKKLATDCGRAGQLVESRHWRDDTNARSLTSEGVSQALAQQYRPTGRARGTERRGEA